MRDDFAIFILTHRRPDKVKTIGALSRSGYTGKWYLVVDDMDPTIAEYQAKFGERVKVFSKEREAERTDACDNFPLRSVLFARNACFDIATEVGVKFFMELDDDYSSFYHTFLGYKYMQRNIKSMDDVLSRMLDFFEGAPAILSLCMSQTGDFPGGEESTFSDAIKTRRKAMNSFLCSTSRPFEFLGQMNDDVNTYLLRSRIGGIFLTTNQLCLSQAVTQTAPGGLTDLYLSMGTYVKSFYSCIVTPSCVKVAFDISTGRLHHRISPNLAYPKILSGEWGIKYGSTD